MTANDLEQTVTALPVTAAALPGFAAANFGERPAQRHARDGAWHDITFTELDGIGREIALGLVALGVAPGDRVGVLADTRPEWLQAEFGIFLAGAVVVPIYPSSSTDECEWVLGNSGAVAVICENAAQLAKVEQVRGALPDLRHTVVIDGAGAEAPTLDDVRAGGADGDPAEIDRRVAAVEPDDPGLIIYTSGTTGRPKGCVLSHRNLTECCRVPTRWGSRAGRTWCTCSCRWPTCSPRSSHGLRRSGGGRGLLQRRAAAIMADLAATSPTVVPSVPRIFEKVYAMVSGLVPAELRARAVGAGLAVRGAAAGGQARARGVAGRVRAGGRSCCSARSARCSAAGRQGHLRRRADRADILRFFHAAGVPVYEGYGMSESTAIGTINTLDGLRIGSVGRAVPGGEVRIADDGEILMRGPQIFSGYWHNPEATAETVVDGWLQTGDLGAIDDDGYLTITGRKKDIIITAGGKNLSPANVENDLRSSRWISQAVMHGDRRPFPVALITLDAEEIGPWAASRGCRRTCRHWPSDPSVRTLIQEVLD